MAANLAPVYVDDRRVNLNGEPRPRIDAILRSLGLHPRTVFVVHLRHRTDPQGRPVAPEETLDRRNLLWNPIYLRTSPKPWIKAATA